MPGNGLAARQLTEKKITTDFQLNRIMKKLVNHFIEKQKSVFLIDSIGACMTAFSLFVIVRQFDAYFGMPKRELTFLSVLAVCFCSYAAACFLFLKAGLKPFIRYMGIANLLYCALTTGLLIKYYPLLTMIGKTYFLIEIVIICVLSYIELTVAASNNGNR